MTKELYFSFGALSAPLSEQYKRQGFRLKDPEVWNWLAESIVELWIRGILTDRRYDECANRIIKFSKKDAEKIEEERTKNDSKGMCDH